eukprot:3288022-Pyramimonas_sp.AAC.1
MVWEEKRLHVEEGAGVRHHLQHEFGTVSIGPVVRPQEGATMAIVGVGRQATTIQWEPRGGGRQGMDRTTRPKSRMEGSTERWVLAITSKDGGVLVRNQQQNPNNQDFRLLTRPGFFLVVLSSKPFGLIPPHPPPRHPSWAVRALAFLEEACRRWCQIYNESSPEFLEVASKFGAAIGVDSASASGIQEIFGRMGKLRSCNEVGPHLKLMRFVSINDCWEWHKKELWGLRAVLKLMSDEHGKGDGLSTVVHAGTSRGATDGDVQQEISKQAGTVKKAFSFINDDLYSSLSIFVTTTCAQRHQYGFRSSQVKTIAQGKNYDYKLQTGAWEDEFIQTVATCMNDVTKIGEMGLVSANDPDGQRGAEAFEFMMRVLKERYDSIAPELFCYPGKFRLALGQGLSTQGKLKVRRDIIMFDWKLILEVEKAALSRPDAKQLLGDIFWLRWPINRLAFGQNERELGAELDIADGFIRTATAATEHWPDSKGPEDVHQHIRDE